MCTLCSNLYNMVHLLRTGGKGWERRSRKVGLADWIKGYRVPGTGSAGDPQVAEAVNERSSFRPLTSRARLGPEDMGSEERSSGPWTTAAAVVIGKEDLDRLERSSGDDGLTKTTKTTKGTNDEGTDDESPSSVVTRSRRTVARCPSPPRRGDLRVALGPGTRYPYPIAQNYAGGGTCAPYRTWRASRMTASGSR